MRMNAREDAPVMKSANALLESVTFFFVAVTTSVGLMVFFNVRLLMVQFGDLFLYTAIFIVCGLLARSLYLHRYIEHIGQRAPTIVSSGLTDENQHLFHQVYNNSPVPYVLLDQAGVITSANMAAARLFKVSVDALVGMPLFNYLSTERPAHAQFLFTRFQSGISFTNEEVMVTPLKESSVAWSLLSLYPFTQIDGQSVGLATLVDITRQKQVESAKSEFVSLASHQLRTPIAGMRWSAELILMDNPDVLSDRQKKYIVRMLESVDRMSLLVDDFLRVSRFELGTFVPEIATVSLPQMVQEVQTDQAATIRRKSLQVQVSIDSKLAAMSTDPNLVRMLVTNLLSNAIKYTPVGGAVTVTGSVSGDACTFSVQDTGMGIPAADQAQIFQKLFRASNATREVPDGTGLGLYIVREAVRVLGGRISFTSAEGLGTTFTAVIPFEPAPDA
jgi:PAS domain S-box-containing protein